MSVLEFTKTNHVSGCSSHRRWPNHIYACSCKTWKGSLRVLAYHTESCDASLTFTSNVLLETKGVRYVRGFRHDSLRKFRLCVAIVRFLCGFNYSLTKRSFKGFLLSFLKTALCNTPRLVPPPPAHWFPCQNTPNWKFPQNFPNLPKVPLNKRFGKFLLFLIF